MVEEKPASPHRLDIRIRRVLSGSGECAARMTVYCSNRQSAIEVEDCARCEHCNGVVLSPDDSRPLLVCRAATEERVAPRPFSWRTSEGVSIWALPDQTPVSRVMTGDVACVTEATSIETLASLLLENGISGAPVVDDTGCPVGVVSKTDLLRERFERPQTEESHTARTTHTTVGDIMTPITYTLNEHATVSQAAALMAFESVHRVPVVDPQGQIVGIVSSIDILRWLARECGYVVPSLNRFHRS